MTREQAGRKVVLVEEPAFEDFATIDGRLAPDNTRSCQAFDPELEPSAYADHVDVGAELIAGFLPDLAAEGGGDLFASLRISGWKPPGLALRPEPVLDQQNATRVVLADPRDRDVELGVPQIQRTPCSGPLMSLQTRRMIFVIAPQAFAGGRPSVDRVTSSTASSSARL